MLEIKQLTRLQIIKYCEKLEKENKSLKEELWILDCKGWTPELVWHSEFLKYLIEENKKLKEEMETLKTIVVNNDLEQKADWKYIEELEEKYEKLKADYIKLSKIVETTWWYKASYVNELRDKIAKLEFDIEALKKLKYGQEEEIIIPIYDEEGKLVMKQ